MENNKPPFWKHTLTMGAIFGVVSILLSLLMWMINYIPASIGGGLLMLLVNLVIIVLILRYAIRSYRNNYLGGFISFGQAFMVAFISILIGAVITQIYTYIFNTIIDPQYMAHVQQVTKDTTEQMLHKRGLSDDIIQTQMDRMDTRFAKQTPLRTFLTGTLWSIVLGAIMSLIMALIMKKDKGAIAS
jgi:hypothetical protein